MHSFELIEFEAKKGKEILDEIADKKYPSLARAAYGYALVLLYQMMSEETDMKKIRAVPKTLDGLIDLGRTDAAYYLFVNLCEEYGIEICSAFTQFTAFGPLVKSFIIELHSRIEDILEDLEPDLAAMGI